MARTLTSLDRVVEVLAVFADDVRVQVSFVISRGSRFGAEVPAVLERLGVRVVDWRDAIKEKFDLVIAASDHADLHQLRGPLVLLPHGAGFQKYSPHATTGSGELAGLTRSALWHDGEIVPSLVGISHENQRGLAPDLADRMFVAGDPALDRLAALARRREQIREQLGIEPAQQLVTVTSTWGPRSLLARWPTLPAQLLAELPWDEFRVAALLHPNTWAAHGSWQIRHWLRTARASGLILIPPTGPWHLGLAAADCVVGDHGSLSAYAAGLSLPLLMAAFGDEEVPENSVMWQLNRSVPWLDGQHSLADQIRRTTSDADRDHLRRLSDQLFSRRDLSLQILQDKRYQLLRLDPLHRAPSPSLPDWRPDEPNLRAFHVEVRADDSSRRYDVDRFPAALAAFARPERSRQLIAFDDADELLLQNASAIVAAAPAADWAEDVLARYPGCRMVVADHGPEDLVLTLRDNRKIHAVCRSESVVPHAMLVSSIWTHRQSVHPTGVQATIAGLRAELRFAAS